MSWQAILTAVPEFLKGAFGIIDQAVVDKDRANEIKLELVTTLAGKGASSWLAQNAFALAMLLNFAVVMIMTLIGRQPPDWALIIALVWLAGPLLNALSKDTLGKIFELVEKTRADKPATKQGGRR